MIIEAFGTGATAILAIEAAKRNLNAPEDALVQVEIVEHEKKKLFGMFGGSEAKARAYYEIDDKPTKTEEKPTKKEEIKPASVVKPDKKEAEKTTTAKPQKTDVVEKNEKQPEKKEAPKKKDTAAKDAPKKANSEKKPKAKAEKPANSTDAPVKVDTTDAVIDYLTAVTKAMGVEDVVITGYTDAANSRFYNIACNSDDITAFLIGKQGSTLDAFQQLARLVSNKSGENYDRITINVGDYREKRKEVLGELAKKQAAKVRKFGRNEALEPMNPYERRIIHTAIQEIEGVSSHSVGSGDNRRVVITLDEGFEPEVKPAAKNKGSNKSNSAKKTDKPAKQDSENTSRYGKISAGAKPKEKKVAEKAAPVKNVKQDSVGSVRYGKIEPKKPVVTENEANDEKSE